MLCSAVGSCMSIMIVLLEVAPERCLCAICCFRLAQRQFCAHCGVQKNICATCARHIWWCRCRIIEEDYDIDYDVDMADVFAVGIAH